MKNPFGLMAVLALALALCSAGCSVKQPNIETYDSKTILPDNTGYLIFATHSSNPSLKLEFLSGVKSYITPEFAAGHQYQMMLLPAGEYRLVAVYADNTQFTPSKASRFKGWDFHVEDNKINYAGEMYVRGNSLNRYVNANAIMKILQNNYPDLLEEHEMVYTGAALN